MNKLISKWRGLSLFKNIPFQVSLELTNKCNERCTHCYLESFVDDPSKVLDLNDWKHILNELRSAGSLYLIFMGGEAMLNKDFWQILEYAKKLGFLNTMITNGLKINKPEVAIELKNRGLSQVTMSMFSLDEEIHDSMTSVKGSLKRTLKAIEYCKSAGINVGINCLLTKANIDNSFDVIDWCHSQEIMITADPMITPKLDGDLTPIQFRASEEQLKKYYAESYRRWPNGIPSLTTLEPDDFVCSAGKSKCAINAYGELLSCIEIRDSLGNLLENSFEKLWNGEVGKKWRNVKNTDVKNIDDEDTFSSLCEHCPGLADHEHGDAFMLTDFTKSIAKAKFEAIPLGK